MSDHMTRIFRLAFFCKWYRARNVNEKVRRIKVEKMTNESVKLDFHEKLNEKLRQSKSVKGEVAVMRKQFKSALLETAMEIVESEVEHGEMKI